MTNEDHLTSLELSKHLKKLGVKQESVWYWWKAGHIFVEEARYAGRQWEKLASAFTVAELGELLPDDFYTTKDTTTGKTIWGCAHYTSSYKLEYPLLEANTEADARAKMLIYLREKQLITL